MNGLADHFRGVCCRVPSGRGAGRRDAREEEGVGGRYARARRGRTLAQGWRGFARDNRLRAQDVCLFQPMEKNHESLTMTVHIIRRRGRRKQ